MAVFLPAALLGLLPWAVQGQEPREWRIVPEAELEVGRDAPSLHVVRAAAMLPDGGVAVADHGNHRLVLVSAEGAVERRIGRRGRGPGELMSVSQVYAFGDTLLAYDPALGRVTTWLRDGTPLGTVRLPDDGQSATALETVVSSERYIVGTRRFDLGPTEFFVVGADLAAFNPLDGSTTPIESRPFAYHYRLAHGSGVTTYRTPFFGELRIARWASGFALAPLDSSVVEVRSGTGDPVATARLPIPNRPFDLEQVIAVRDSLLERTRRNPAFARPEIQRNLREAFEGILRVAPAGSPPIRDLVSMGRYVWVERFPLRRDPTVMWFVVDPASGTVCGRVEVPRDVVVLGGKEDAVILLARSPLDEEIVRVHAVEGADDCS